MPHEITAYLTLEKNTGLGATREVIAMVALDEGFDRPYWKRFDRRGKAVVSQSPEKIFEEGIFTLMREVEREDSIHISHPENGDTLVLEEGNPLSAIASIDEGYSLSLLVYEYSMMSQYIEAFLELPAEKHLLMEVASRDVDRSKLPEQKF